MSQVDLPMYVFPYWGNSSLVNKTHIQFLLDTNEQIFFKCLHYFVFTTELWATSCLKAAGLCFDCKRKHIPLMAVHTWPLYVSQGFPND